MGALADEVTSRVPARVLRELTNDTQQPTSIDTAQLALAVADTEAAMEIHANVAYDGDNSRHVRTGIRGVLLHLQVYKGEDKAVHDRLEAWFKECGKLKLVERHDRVIPKSTSRLTPTTEAPGSTVQRPLTDPQTFWQDVLPRSRADRRTRGGFPGRGQ